MRPAFVNRYLDMGVEGAPQRYLPGQIRMSNGLALMSAGCTLLGGFAGLAHWGRLVLLLWGLSFTLLFLFTPLLNFRKRYSAARLLLQVSLLVSIVIFHLCFVIDASNSGIRVMLLAVAVTPLFLANEHERAWAVTASLVACVALLTQPLWHSVPYAVAGRMVSTGGLFDYTCYGVSASVVLGGYLLLWQRNNIAEAELTRAIENRKKTTLQFVTLTKTLSQQREETRQKSDQIRMMAEELTGKNDQLNGALSKLKETQQQLIITEKTASLGKLISNVAHEINTPIGAIRASATNLETLASTFLADVPQRIRSFGAAQNELFEKLLSSESALDFALMSTREQRELKRQLQSELALARINEASEIATILIQCEISKVSPYIEALRAPTAKAVLEVAAGFKQLHNAARTILKSTDKTRRVVFALRAFLNSDEPSHVQRVRVKTSIEHVLENYALLFKVGIRLVTNWEASPTVLGDEEELTQVWTNLVYNAVQAMHGRGTLTIKLQVLNGTATVLISDTGEGISPEVKSRLFEPFFTTKESGEGIGLGLFQTKRIVENHKGNLTFTSAPGNTQFTVSLPLID